MINFVKQYVWAIVGAIIAILIGVIITQKFSNLGLELDIQTMESNAAQLESARSAAVTKRLADLSAIKDTHAKQQQEKESEYQKNLKVRSLMVDTERAASSKLRGQLAAITAASGRRPGDTDATAYERAANRLKIVGTLLDEGISLVTESRGIVAGRDGEVDLLLNQIKIDRLACQK